MKRLASVLSILCVSAALIGGVTRAAMASHHKHAAVKYKAHCGMIYTAAQAKRNHYVCPMDHKPLMKMAASSAHKKGAMGRMKM